MTSNLDLSMNIILIYLTYMWIYMWDAWDQLTLDIKFNFAIPNLIYIWSKTNIIFLAHMTFISHMADLTIVNCKI
jgi:hypothetical protein